jgi:hypothetical protein
MTATNTAIEVSSARSKQEQEEFLRFPWLLYEGDPNWVPNLLMLQRDVISRKRNPFFDHGDAELLIARRNGAPVGRISASIDHRHNDFHNEKSGFFGFFESENDPEVATQLLTTAEAWLRERGMDRVLGPLSFSIDEEVGMLVEGFDMPPMIGMTYAPPYYTELLQQAGYGKEIDLLAYRWNVVDPPERMMEAIEKTRAAAGLKIRKINMRRLHRDVDLLLEIYNESWQDNWGYVQVSPRAARKMAGDLRLIADPGIVLIAEVDGEPAGMVVGLPNLYEAIRDFNGFIDPIKLAKLVWRLKVRGTETGRILLFGVKPKFQRVRDLYGLPFLLLYELYAAAKKKRYKWCEESWILETNTRLNALMPYWNAYVYKKYRIFRKAL